MGASTGSSITDEVMSYFDNPRIPFAPSQIDWAMGLRKGLAHDLIVQRWLADKERALRAKIGRRA